MIDDLEWKDSSLGTLLEFICRILEWQLTPIIKSTTFKTLGTFQQEEPIQHQRRLPVSQRRRVPCRSDPFFPSCTCASFLSRALASAQSILPVGSLLSPFCQRALRVVVVNNGGIRSGIIVSRYRRGPEPLGCCQGSLPGSAMHGSQQAAVGEAHQTREIRLGRQGGGERRA